MNKRAVGENYEQMAARYLQSQGARIVECNFHSRKGEIDLIMWESGYLVFVEVKYRRDGQTGDPLEAVDREIRQRQSHCKSKGVSARPPNIIFIPDIFPRIPQYVTMWWQFVGMRLPGIEMPLNICGKGIFTQTVPQ